MNADIPARTWKPCETMRELATRVTHLTQMADLLLNGPPGAALEKPEDAMIALVVIALPLGDTLLEPDMEVVNEGIAAMSNQSAIMMFGGIDENALVAVLKEMAFSVEVRLRTQGQAHEPGRA